MKIEVGKTYIDNHDTKWRVVSLEGPEYMNVIAVNYEVSTIRAFTLDGTVYDTDPLYSLVSEYSPWNDVKVDTPIWVRDDDRDDWKPRHFAKYEDGVIYAWATGETSHSIGYIIGGDMEEFVTYWTQATLVNPNKVEGKSK